jgi:hypothetical protein
MRPGLEKALLLGAMGDRAQLIDCAPQILPDRHKVLMHGLGIGVWIMRNRARRNNRSSADQNARCRRGWRDRWVKELHF